MARISRVIAAAVIAAAASGAALADDGGDNGMNPFYGDSWAWLQGQGRNTAGEMVMPGAYSVVPPYSTSDTRLAERMRQTQARMREQWQRTMAALSGNRVATPVSPPAPRTAPPPNTFENDTGG
jgi:hypothetical protein